MSCWRCWVRAFEMKRLLKSSGGKLVFLLIVSAIQSTFAAEHLEIQIKLHTTSKTQTQTNEHEITALCVLGTNDWYISGQFLRNAHVEYWSTGTTILERKVINKGMYWEQTKDFISEKLGTDRRTPVLGTYPAPGESWTQTNSWLAPFGYGIERVVWLAFCSGTFLRLPDRQVPLPVGPVSQAEGYVDKTVLLEDQTGLSGPKTVNLFTTNGGLVCSYNALALTNLSDRLFPLTFRLIQYSSDGHKVATNASHAIVVGKVHSIKKGRMPPIPDLESSRKH